MSEESSSNNEQSQFDEVAKKATIVGKWSDGLLVNAVFRKESNPESAVAVESQTVVDGMALFQAYQLICDLTGVEPNSEVEGKIMKTFQPAGMSDARYVEVIQAAKQGLSRFTNQADKKAMKK